LPFFAGEFAGLVDRRLSGFGLGWAAFGNRCCLLAAAFYLIQGRSGRFSYRAFCSP